MERIDNLRYDAKALADEAEEIRTAIERNESKEFLVKLARSHQNAAYRFVNSLPAVATEWLTVQNIAEELQVNQETVRRWIRSGELVAQPLSAHVRPRHRIHRRDLDAFLQKRGTGRTD